MVLRQGQIVADLDPRAPHPDDVVALLSGQQVDASARRQLTRLHGLADRLVSADPSSSLSLILSALGAALSTEHLCIHLVDRPEPDLRRVARVLAGQLAAWSALPFGAGGGPVGLAAAAEEPVIEKDVRASATWAEYSELAAAARRGEFLVCSGAWPGRAQWGDHRLPRRPGRPAAGRAGPGHALRRVTPPARWSVTGCLTRSPRGTGSSRRSGRCWRPWPGRSRSPRAWSSRSSRCGAGCRLTRSPC